MANAVSEVLGGVGLLGRGLGLITRRPRLFWLGAVPPLIMSVVFTTLLVVLLINLPDLVRVATPFAAGWNVSVAEAFRVLVGIALVGGAVLIMVVSFTTLTLAIGAPIYDKISEAVDAELDPDLRAPQEKVVTSATRAVRQSLTLIAISVLVAVPLFAIGLVPVVGQVAGPVLSAIFGGWMLAIELVGSAFERRGRLRLAQRRAALQTRRLRTLGFAVPVFVLSAIPFLGVVVFPVATAAGTLLARDLLGEDAATQPGVTGPG